MADATATFTVKAKADVDEAVRGLQRVEGATEQAGDATETLGDQARAAAAGLLSAEEAAELLAKANEQVGDTAKAAGDGLDGMGQAAGGAADGLGDVGDQVSTLVQLNLLETIKSIGTSFNDLSSRLRMVEQGFTETAESIEDPFTRKLVEAASAVAGFGADAAGVVGVTLELGAAVAQVASVIPQLPQIMAAVTAGFTTARAAVTAFVTTMSVATLGIGAAVVAAGYAVERYFAWQEAIGEVNEALAESARQSRANAATLNEFFTAFAGLTEQAERLQEAIGETATSQDAANTYIARTIALQRESLGLYDEEYATQERIQALQEARMRFAETERAQTQIQSLLLAGIEEQEVARVVNLQFQAEAARLTTSQLQEWLDYLPQINEQLAQTQDRSGYIAAAVTEFVAPLRQFFDTIGNVDVGTSAIQRTGSAIDTVSASMAEQIAEMNAQDAAWTQLIERWNQAGQQLRNLTENQVKLNLLFDVERAEYDAARLVEIAIEAKEKIAAALYVDPETGFGLSIALGKEYDAAREAMTMLGSAAESLGSALSAGLGAALAAQEDFGKAFVAAVGQSLVSSGIQTVLEGLKALIPLPGLFNPVAAATAGATGGAMIIAGKLMGGKGNAPSGGGGGGGRSVGESAGLAPVPMAGPQAPVTLTDFTGVTIVTNDVDSMRTFTERQTRTAETGGTARV